MEIFSLFTTIHNPKTHSKEYLFLDLVFLIMSAVISGAKTWKEIQLFGECRLEWLRQYRPFSQGIPDDKTLASLVTYLNPRMFNEIFINLLNDIRKMRGYPLIKVDRRVLYKQFTSETQASLYGITLWCKPQGFVFTQYNPSSLKHEKLGILEFLDAFYLKNTIVSVNSLNTQKKIANNLKKQKSDYILPLKDSHTHFQAELSAYFHKLERESPRKIKVFKNTDKDKIEERIYRKVLIDNEWFSEVKHWKGIKSIVSLTYKKRYREKHYFYLSSLSEPVEKIAQSIITHDLTHQKFSWQVDMIYQNIPKITIKSGTENLAKLHRFALKLTEHHPLKDSMKNKLIRASWSDSFRDELILGIK